MISRASGSCPRMARTEFMRFFRGSVRSMLYSNGDAVAYTVTSKAAVQASEGGPRLAWLAPRLSLHFMRLTANAVWVWMYREAGFVLPRVSVACKRR